MNKLLRQCDWNRRQVVTCILVLVGCCLALIYWGGLANSDMSSAKIVKPERKLAASDPFSYQGFGGDVAVSGSSVVLSSMLADMQQERRGVKGDDWPETVYVYNAETGRPTAELVPPKAVQQNAPWRVAASRKWAVITCWDSSDGNVAYVFDVQNGKYTRSLRPRDLNEQSSFGYSVCLNDDQAIIGVRGLSGAHGVAYVFDLRDGRQKAKLVTGDVISSDGFAHSVALAESYAVVGAPTADVEGHSGAGAAYVFDLKGDKKPRRLTSPRPGADNSFGLSVAVHRSKVVVGEPGAGPEEDRPGAAYIFDARTGRLDVSLRPHGSSKGDNFGGAIALSGESVVVGARMADVNNMENCGAAYVFDLAMGVQLATLLPHDLEEGDIFGMPVAAGTEWIAVSSPGGNVDGVEDTGAVYLFKTHDLGHKPPASQPSRTTGK